MCVGVLYLNHVAKGIALMAFGLLLDCNRRLGAGPSFVIHERRIDEEYFHDLVNGMEAALVCTFDKKLPHKCISFILHSSAT